MSNKLEKKYPRIFSLSTIGLIHHYNMDYVFHPFRTDFSGESGIGKTTIANLLQLIFVGNKYFTPASNSSYKPAGYVLKPQDFKHKNIGYAFLNIEIEKGKFIIIGVFLKAGSNHVEHFIIYNGYEVEKLKDNFFTSPIFYKNLIENDNIIPLNELIDSKKHKYRVEKFEVVKFQEILYINEILPFDLYASEEKTSRFAKIMKSFSAGKDIEWNSPKKLQEFLFGNEDYESIRKEYEEGVKEIENKYESSYKNDADIEKVRKKASDIQELAELYAKKQEAEKEYRIARNVYWYYQKEKIEIIDLKNARNKLWKLDTEIILLEKEEKVEKQEKLKGEISEIESKLARLNAVKINIQQYSNINFCQEKDKIEKELRKITPQSNNIETIEKLLKEFASIEEITQKFNHYLQKKEIKIFQNYLAQKSIEKTDWLHEFDKSEWSKGFEKGERQYEIELEKNKVRIIELNSLKAFSNYNEQYSLIKWSVDKVITKSFTEIQESVIAHFFILYLRKPKAIKCNQYIPKPEDLLDILNDKKNIEKDGNGFWLNLSGIREFIEYRKTYFLNKQNAIEEIQKYAKQTDDEIEKIEKQKQKQANLRNYLNSYGNRKIFEIYPNKESILAENEHKIFEDISNTENFKKILLDYDKKNEIEKEYKNWKEKEKENIRKEKAFNDLIKEKDDLIISSENNKQIDKQDEINEIGFKLNIIGSKIIKLQEDDRFNKISIDLINDLNKSKNKTEHLNEIWRKKIEQKGKIETEIEKFEEQFKKAESEYNIAENECKLFNYEVNKNFLKDKYITIPEIPEKEENAFNGHCSYLTKHYLPDNSEIKDTKDYKTLVKKILPQLFSKVKFEEKEVVERIGKHLTEINDLAKEINSLFVQLLTGRFNKVINAYQTYKTKYDKIKIFFQKKDVEITGGYKVELTFDPVPDFPVDFLDAVKGELNNKMSYTKGLFLQNMPTKKDIETIIFDIYKKYSQNNEISVLDILNPMKYFSMSFSMKKNGKQTDGSTGQKYASIALLCIAQMSEIYKNNDIAPKGIRYMPIDDAQDLGSNYEMLYNIAAKEDFQIITFSIAPLDDNENDNQNWYMLNENKEEQQINNPPFAILSGTKETIFDWEKYLNDNYNEQKP